MKVCTKKGHEYPDDKDRCPECKRDWQRDYQQRNRDKINATNRKSYEKHAETRRARTLEYYHRNQDKYREYDRNRGTEYYRARGQKRRALLVDAFVEAVDELLVFERDNWVCKLCGEPVDKMLVFPNQMVASLDHVVPLANGGEHSYANVQCSHLRCNKRKSNRV